MNLNEQAYLFKRLAFLTHASVSLVEGLSVLRSQSSGQQNKVLAQLVNDVAGGQSLSRACSKFPKVFSKFSISIITVGEASGTLSQNLEHLAEELKKKQILQRKILSAFVYPSVIVLATLGITAFLMLYLFPKITPIFSSLHVELPLSTKIVMGTSLFLQDWGVVLIVAVVLALVGIVIALRNSKRLRLWFDAVLLHLPIIGSVLRYYNVSNATRTLGVLLQSGVQLSHALLILSEATSNRIYKKQCFALARVVNRGDRISTYLKAQQKYFPEIMCHMVAVGERSGSLPQTLLYLSDLYDTEVEEFTKNLSTLMEPALMIFMGVLVGFIAISIITPIYGITQNLHA